MDVGLELRQARERRGMSLQQIAHATKISPRVLQAIEASDQSRMPAPVFTRSFVRTYAGEVGLDPDEITRRYVQELAPPEPAPDVEEPSEPPDAGRGSPRTTAAVLIVVALAAIALGVRNYRHANANATRADAKPAAGATAVVPAARPEPAPVGTSGTAPAAPEALRLAIAPTGPCWVQATVDGQSVLAKLLDSGDRREVQTASDVTLRIGDAAAFAWSINGTPARVPGKPGQPVTVHVTKANFRQFLAK